MRRTVHFLLALVALTTSGSLTGCQQRTREPARRPATATRAASEKIKLDVDLDSLQGRTVLVVTHPSRHILESLVTLVEKKLLDIPGLYVVGVYHKAELESYAPSRSYLRKKRVAWLGLKPLSCALQADEVFRNNPCTPQFRELLDRSAGMLFTGGPDIPPAMYREKTLLTTVVRAPRRHHWEVSLLFHLLGSSRNPGLKPLLDARTEYPVLAICLGLQSMNVAAGGTLYQDIFAEIYGARTFEDILALDPDLVHRNPHYYLNPDEGVWPGTFHPIRFTSALEMWRSVIPDVKPVQVMSVHHQAIEKLGRDLEVTATSKDGKVVEAIRHTRFPNVLGIQFHPEYNVIWDASVTATERAEDPPGNVFRSRLTRDPRSLGFHRELWRMISSRFASGGRKVDGR